MAKFMPLVLKMRLPEVGNSAPDAFKANGESNKI